MKTLTRNKASGLRPGALTTQLKNNAQKYLRKRYVRRLEPDEDGGFVASIQEFPGLVAEGETPDEAYAKLDRAAESWLEVALAHGQHIKEPVDFDGCSGKVALRMPRSLHRQAAELAELEGTSLNQFLVTAIAHYVGGKSLVETLRQEALSSAGNSFQANFLICNFHVNRQAISTDVRVSQPQLRGAPPVVQSFITTTPALTETRHG